MQADGLAGRDDHVLSNVRRKGLRIALAVAVGLTWAVHSGAVIPFLGPFFAAQFLVSDARPLSLRKAVGTVGLILVAGLILQFVTVVAGHRPVVLLLLLGLVYFLCFHLQAKGKAGGPAIFFVLVVAVLVPLMSILDHQLSASIMSAMIEGVVGGTLLMWLAHALIPDKGSTASDPVPAVAIPDATRIAACNAVILLIAVAACLTVDGLATAIVVPVTVASLLSQSDVVRSARAAMNLVMVNLFGGVVASVAFVVYSIRPTGIALFLIVLTVGLMFGGRAAQSDPMARLHAGALTIFLLVFGMGVSPLPGSAAETFFSRITYILLAIAYTIFMAALLWPRTRIAASQPNPEPSSAGRLPSEVSR